MNRLAARLRIGEKIGLGFGAIGLLFLSVTAYCQMNLARVVDGYEALNAVYGERQAAAFAIESRLTAMSGAAERFLLTRNPEHAEQAREQAAALAERIIALGDIDAASGRTAAQLQALTDDFRERFDAIVSAWEIRGLDEDSGLQGAFRNAAHELEERAGQYNVDQAYLLLLQVRRREKDLGLRRDPAYQQQVHELLDAMTATVAGSTLAAPLQDAIADELATYREALDQYAEQVLAGDAIDGGKGPFRDAAHRVEDLLRAHLVPGLEVQVLQLRRREKDYLLRGDTEYVAMVDALLADMRGRIAAAPIPDAERASLDGLLSAYGRDFHALVEQNRRIATLTTEMQAAAARITPLVQANLTEAQDRMESMSREIADSAAARTRASLLVAVLAAAVGTLFAVLITWRIVRPVRRMAGILYELTRENPRGRMPTVANGRDEINAMAIALNHVVDYKATFSDWWRSSMQEAIALRDRNLAKTADERADAEQQLAEAAGAKRQQLDGVHRQLQQRAERVSQLADRLAAEHGSAQELAELRDAATDVRTLSNSIQRP